MQDEINKCLIKTVLDTQFVSVAECMSDEGSVASCQILLSLTIYNSQKQRSIRIPLSSLEGRVAPVRTMSSSLLIKVALVVAGLVVGGGLTYGVMKLTESSSGSEDTTSTPATTTTISSTTVQSNTSSDGTRVVDTLQYVVLVRNVFIAS